MQTGLASQQKPSAAEHHFVPGVHLGGAELQRASLHSQTAVLPLQRAAVALQEAFADSQRAVCYLQGADAGLQGASACQQRAAASACSLLVVAALGLESCLGVVMKERQQGLAWGCQGVVQALLH